MLMSMLTMLITMVLMRTDPVNAQTSGRNYAKASSRSVECRQLYTREEHGYGSDEKTIPVHAMLLTGETLHEKT